MLPAMSGKPVVCRHAILLFGPAQYSHLGVGFSTRRPKIIIHEGEMTSSHADCESLDNVPLSPSARDYYERIFKPRLNKMKSEITATPLAILVWGPGPNNPLLYAKRMQIRDELRNRGHAAFFSEDLSAERPTDYSQKAIEFLEARVADLVVVLQVSYGSIAEVHDFADDRVINAKMLIFISQSATDGYIYQGALSELKTLYGNIVTFNEPDDIVTCRLKTLVIEKVAVMQVLKWRATVNAKSWGLSGE